MNLNFEQSVCFGVLMQFLLWLLIKVGAIYKFLIYNNVWNFE